MIQYDESTYPSYGGIVRDWGYEVVDQATFGSYQGDYVYLLKSGGQYGWIVIGYGSCSGCDHLEAIQGWGDEYWNDAVRQYAEELRMRVLWLSAEGLIQYLTDEYLQAGKWEYYDDEYKAFASKVVEDLNAELGRTTV